MWKNNTVQLESKHMAIWRMHFACWITKATHTHTHSLTICNTYRFATAIIVTRRRLSVKFTHTLHFLLVLYSKIHTAVYCTDYMEHKYTRILRGLNAGLISVKFDTIYLPIRITKLIFFNDMFVFQNSLG